jgi:hypothetical protein
VFVQHQVIFLRVDIMRLRKASRPCKSNQGSWPKYFQEYYCFVYYGTPKNNEKKGQDMPLSFVSLCN